ncbi:prenyltransferase [bacterium]|nr:prenyltransferase [bacterium]
MSSFKQFMEVTRGYSVLMTFASCIVIYAYAHLHDNFTYLNFFFLILALVCVHLGANLYDDWQDVKQRLKKGEKLEEIKFAGFSPKARLITNGTYSIQQIRRAIGIFFIIATSIGLCFGIASGPIVFLFMLIGALLTLVYPFASKYSLAEVIVGLIWGPLVIMGGYCALTGEIQMKLFPLSFAIFFTTVALLHVNNIMDWEFDKENGKNTLAILAKTKPDAIKLLQAMVIIPYIILIGGVLAGVYTPYILLTFLTLPMAIKLISSMKEYIEIKDVKFIPKWYLGIFENWKAIQEQKIDFLMFRMYLARNLSFFFALFMTLGLILGGK